MKIAFDGQDVRLGKEISDKGDSDAVDSRSDWIELPLTTLNHTTFLGRDLSLSESVMEGFELTLQERAQVKRALSDLKESIREIERQQKRFNEEGTIVIDSMPEPVLEELLRQLREVPGEEIPAMAESQCWKSSFANCESAWCRPCRGYEASRSINW